MTSTTKNDCPEPANEKETASPFVHEYFIVQCLGYLGMAYRNSEGKWLDAFTHRQLAGEVRILG
jgi:hypothetical protein